MNEMDIVHKIMRLIHLFRQEQATILGEKDKEMSHRDFMVLDAILKLNPIDRYVKMSELSAHFQVTPAAISQTVNTLEKKGWVERIHLEHDRRSVYVKVKEEAIQHMRKKGDLMKKNLASFITMLGEDDAQALIRILEKAILYTKEHPCGEKKGD